MGEKTAFENGRISDFHGLVTLTLTSIGSYCVLVDLYLHTKFH